MASPETWADWLGVVGSVASLASFGAAGYAAVKLRAISRRILFNVRADEISCEIEIFPSWFTENVVGFPGNHHEMDSRIQRCLALLYRIETVVPLEARPHVKMLHSLETQYFGTAWANDVDSVRARRGVLWKLYTEIENVLMHIRHSNADRRLGGRNEDR